MLIVGTMFTFSKSITKSHISNYREILKGLYWKLKGGT